MDIRDRRSLKASAAQALTACSGSPGRLALLYAGAMALFSMGTVLLDHWLRNMGESASGLSGMDTISVLETVRQLLNIVAAFAPVCWTMGYSRAALRMGRGEGADPRDLLCGFRRFGAVLRYSLLEGVVVIVVTMAVCSVGGTVLCMTPLAAPAYEILMPLMEDADALTAAMQDEAVMNALTEAMLPVVIGCVALTLLALIPVLFRMRFARYLLMDDPASGAVAAMVGSFRLTKGSCLRLLGLDVSFWWYYLASGAISVLAYGDVLLSLAGISLPLSSDTAFYAFYAISLLAQLALYGAALNGVECTYVRAYDILLEASAAPAAPAPAVRPAAGQPWGEPPMQDLG